MQLPVQSVTARKGAKARYTLGALLACAAVLLLPPVAVAVGTLDQSQTSITGSHSVTASQSAAQTFTPAKTGVLDRVDVFVGASAAGGDLLVEIVVAAPDGSPTGAILASTVVPYSVVASFGLAGGWVAVDLVVPAPVTAETRAAIRLTSPLGVYHWYVSQFDPYSRGSAWLRFGQPPAWIQVSQDFAFRTYVTEALPQVTVASLCRDTIAAVKSSPRYPANRRTLDALTTRLCDGLATTVPRLTVTQKAKLIAAYKLGVRALRVSGWITAAQAADLTAKADRLAAGSG